MAWHRISFGIKVASAVFLFVGASLALVLFSPEKDRLATALIGDRIFKLEVADTSLLMERGLAGRINIPKDGGMIFLFSKPGPHSFWVKGMLMPIDIPWLKNNAIVFIRENIKPPEAGLAADKLERFAPPEESDAIIEIAAGTAKWSGFHIGQSVRILIP